MNQGCHATKPYCLGQYLTVSVAQTLNCLIFVASVFVTSIIPPPHASPGVAKSKQSSQSGHSKKQVSTCNWV